MNVINTTLDLEVHEYFDDNGHLIISVFTKGAEEPLIEHEIQISSVVNDWLDVVTNPQDDLIEDSEDEEMAENIVDNLQDAIDLINDALRDYDNLTN